MNKLLKFLLCLSFIGFWASPVLADSLVSEDNALDGYTNPQRLHPSNPDTEEEWLEGLLGLTYDNPSVEFISKDEDDDLFDVVPAVWTYAVLKYGVGKPSDDNPDHWAIMDDGDNLLDLRDIDGLPSQGLSHISYFGAAAPVPEPATMLLFGTGLVGLAALTRRKKK